MSKIFRCEGATQHTEAEHSTRGREENKVIIDVEECTRKRGRNEGERQAGRERDELIDSCIHRLDSLLVS